jgi:hypothetical protein
MLSRNFAIFAMAWGNFRKTMLFFLVKIVEVLNAHYCSLWLKTLKEFLIRPFA